MLRPVTEYVIAVSPVVDKVTVGQADVFSKEGIKTLDPNIRQLQDDLAARLGARVQIQHGPKGKGKLVLTYNSLEELDGILGHIK